MTEPDETLKRVLEQSAREDEDQKRLRKRDRLQLREALALSLSEQKSPDIQRPSSFACALSRAKRLSELEHLALNQAADLQRRGSSIDARFRDARAAAPDYLGEADNHLRLRGISTGEGNRSRSKAEPLELKCQPTDSASIFVDNSNIEGGAEREGKKLDIAVLAKVVERGRGSIRKRLVFGSKNSSDTVFDAWKSAGYSVHVALKVGKEDFVDDACVAMILAEVAKEEVPKTIVLLTGDGNGNDGRANFFEAVWIALLKGWKCEVWSWRASQSSKYRDMDRAYEGTGRFLLQYLDAFKCELSTGSRPIAPRGQPSQNTPAAGRCGHKTNNCAHLQPSQLPQPRQLHAAPRRTVSEPARQLRAAPRRTVSEPGAVSQLPPGGTHQQAMPRQWQAASSAWPGVTPAHQFAGKGQQAAATTQRLVNRKPAAHHPQLAGGNESRRQQAAGRSPQLAGRKWSVATRLLNGRPLAARGHHGKGGGRQHRGASRQATGRSGKARPSQEKRRRRAIKRLGKGRHAIKRCMKS